MGQEYQREIVFCPDIYPSIHPSIHPSIVHGSGARGMRAFSNWIHELCRRISFCGGDGGGEGRGGAEGSSLFLELVLGA
jgi:hypothetical protein